MTEYKYTPHPTKRKPSGKSQSMLLHRRVWEIHNGEIPKGHVIHHINHDKLDNRIENLECLTRKEHGERHNDKKK